MDIRQLKYFISIVENDCNMSVAARKEHVSQPALSKLIKQFEDEQQLELFVRKNGRLEELSPAGKKFYEDAKQLLNAHELMMSKLNEYKPNLSGKIRIGIPPVVFPILFAEVVSQLVQEYTSVEFQVFEIGAHALRDQLISGNLDIGVLLEPTNLDLESYQQVRVCNETLDVFLSVNHPLSSQKTISWHDIDGKDITLFNEAFMIHHLIMDKCKQEGIAPRVIMQSSMWDLMVNFTQFSNVLTILPAPLRAHVNHDKVAICHFDDPVMWRSTICVNRLKLENPLISTIYSELEKRVTVDNF